MIATRKRPVVAHRLVKNRDPRYGAPAITPVRTSFGRNGNCVGTGGVFRTDRKNVLDFVRQYLR